MRCDAGEMTAGSLTGKDGLTQGRELPSVS
jgi:hypothetical protein